MAAAAESAASECQGRLHFAIPGGTTPVTEDSWKEWVVDKTNVTRVTIPLSVLKDTDARYKVKRALVEAQIAELGGIATRPGAALQPTEATLAAATKVELLGGGQLLVSGLTQLKNHKVSLERYRGPTISVHVDTSFEQKAADILAIGWIDSGDVDPANSTAGGKGLAVAQVGEMSEFVVTAVGVGTWGHRSVGGDKVVVNSAARTVVNHVLPKSYTVTHGARRRFDGGIGDTPLDFVH